VTRSPRRIDHRAPWWIVAPAALGVALLVLPLLGLLARASLSDLARDLASAEVVAALRLSLVCSLAATAIAIPLGLPLAWILARSEARGLRWLRALVTLPMVLPPVVGGVALLFAFGRRGLVGQWVHDAFGVSLPFTTAAVIVAETFVAMPFLVAAAEAGFRQVDRRLEEAAETLGAGRARTLLGVTIPLALPALGAGAVLCWARALGEFGATITFAGNLPGVTQTLPLAVYVALETRPEAAIALSLLMLALSLTVLAALRDRWLPR
jgi:molybdate transport system permease protein